MNSKSIFIFLFLILLSCSTNEYKNLKRKKVKIDVIERSQGDVFCNIDALEKNQMPLYPFEEETHGLFKITKEFFRCKGNPLNLERIDSSNSDDIKVYLDCEGPTKHSLPLISGKEGVFPVLIDILNYIQRKTKKKIVITCGHRCPKHNAYADIIHDAKTSKHMVGAEVDFYVAGLENSPQKIIDLIIEYYKENPKYKGIDEFENFLTFQKQSDASTLPIYNKEIFIKLFQFNEGRDFDNRHPYPYISIQVLWDRSTKEKVSYSWDKAHKSYLH